MVTPSRCEGSVGLTGVPGLFVSSQSRKSPWRTQKGPTVPLGAALLSAGPVKFQR